MGRCTTLMKDWEPRPPAGQAATNDQTLRYRPEASGATAVVALVAVAGA